MTRSPFNPQLLGFDCLACGALVELAKLSPVCPACGRPLVARYDLERLRAEWRRDDLERFGKDLWRWTPVLPFDSEFRPARRGEGGPPLLPMSRLAERFELDQLLLKDEAGNPTQSFKARGLALAGAGAAAVGQRAAAPPRALRARSAPAQGRGRQSHAIVQGSRPGARGRGRRGAGQARDRAALG